MLIKLNIIDAFPIFKAFGVAKSIDTYFGFIDSVSSDMNKLLHQSFNSATQNLEYARSSQGDNLHHYFQKAHDDFISSFYLEQDKKMISAYLSAPTCQYLQGDHYNAIIILLKN